MMLGVGKIVEDEHTVRSFIGDQRSDSEVVDKRLDADAVTPLARQQAEARKIAESVARATILVVSPTRERPMA